MVPGGILEPRMLKIGTQDAEGKEPRMLKLGTQDAEVGTQDAEVGTQDAELGTQDAEARNPKIMHPRGVPWELIIGGS